MALCFSRRLFALIAAVCMGGALAVPAQAQTTACQITVDSSAALTEVLLRPGDQKAGLAVCLPPFDEMNMRCVSLHLNAREREIYVYKVR